jgi:hypothetical protein
MLDNMRQRRRFSFNSLRVQLLIWIAIPAAIVLLVVSYAEIRGHERAMQRLVQERADGLAEAVAALVAARVDRSKDVLLQMAGDPAIRIAGDPFRAAAESSHLPEVSLFSSGFALLDTDGTPIAANGDRSWLTWPEVGDLTEQVLASQAAATLATQYEDGWLLLQAAPVRATNGEADTVLIGAMPLRALDLTGLVRKLALSTNADLYIQTSEGYPLFEFNQNEQAISQGKDDRVVTAQTVI